METALRRLLLLLLLPGLGVGDSASRRKAYGDHLRELLARNISSSVPPLPANGSIAVEAAFDLHRVISLDSASGVLNALGTLRVAWAEPRLAWTGGPEAVVLAAEALWVPQLGLQTSAALDGPLAGAGTAVRVARSGRATLQRALRLAASCAVDVRRFPRDVQHCQLLFVAPIGYRTLMRPSARPRRSVNVSRNVGEEWALLGRADGVVQVKVAGSDGREEAVPAYRVSLLLGRNQAFYLLTLIAPSFLLALIMLVPFVLPPSQCQSKLLIPITTFLSVNVYMLLLEKSLPKTAALPVLGQVYAVLLAVGVVAELFQAFSVKFYSCHVKVMPRAYSVLYLQVLAPLLCLGACHGVSAKVKKDDDEEEEPEEVLQRVQKQWRTVGRVNDRLGLLLCSVMVLASWLLLFVRCYVPAEVPPAFLDGIEDL